jgi:hypothetical protein
LKEAFKNQLFSELILGDDSDRFMNVLPNNDLRIDQQNNNSPAATNSV